MQCAVCPVSPIICKHPVTTRGSQRCESKRRFYCSPLRTSPGDLSPFLPIEASALPSTNITLSLRATAAEWPNLSKQHGQLQRVLTTHKCLFSGPFFFFPSSSVLVSWRLNGHLISISKKVKANKSIAVAR